MGTVVVGYDYYSDMFYLNMTVGNLQGNITGIHIHRGNSTTNGPVVVVLPASNFVQYASDNDSLYYDLFYGDLYVNVHTTAFPGGEIRGQLMSTETGGMISLEPNGVASYGRGTGSFH